MQTELQRKNSLLQTTEDRIADLSNQRHCFSELEGKLRKTIQELKAELNEKDAIIRRFQGNLDPADGTRDQMKIHNELKALQTENERLQRLLNKLQCCCSGKHVDKMLKESKNAMGVVVNEIQNGPNPDDSPGNQHLAEENRQLKRHSKDIQNEATKRVNELNDKLQQLLQENDRLVAENEYLKSASQGKILPPANRVVRCNNCGKRPPRF